MAADDLEVQESEQEGAGALFFVASAVTALCLLALLAVSMLPMLSGAPATRAAPPLPQALPAAAGTLPQRPQAFSTVLYVVSSQAEAEHLTQAFADWDQAIREQGFHPSDVARLVLVGSLSESDVRLASDLSVFAGGGPGVYVIDLRR